MVLYLTYIIMSRGFMKTGYDIVDEMAEKGYSFVECSSCSDFGFRKLVGISPNRKRKYYVNENGNVWRGKVCPKCCKANHTRYMKSYRMVKK